MNLLGYAVAQALALLMIGVLSLVEHRYPAGLPPPGPKQRLNLQIYALGILLAPLYEILFQASASRIRPIFDLGVIKQEFHGAWKVIGILIAGLIWKAIGDFFFYWFHRFQHCSFLWQQHKLHHLDENVSSLTTGRTHWLEGILIIPARLIPLAILFKFDRTSGIIAGGLVGLLDTFWHLSNHANLKVSFGRFSCILTSPQQHRIHHSRLPEHRNKNFAALFPIWDVLFGTYYHPKAGEYPPTGIDGGRDVESFKDATLLPFKEWRRSWSTAFKGSAELSN